MSVPDSKRRVRSCLARPSRTLISCAISEAECSGMTAISPSALPSMTLWASLYASFVADLKAHSLNMTKQLKVREILEKNTHLTMVLPNHFFTTLASFVMVKTTENARRSCPGRRLQSCSLSAGGSIGTARCTKYTLVARFLASRSRAVLGFTKNDTSAMWTPISYVPSSLALTDNASSKSLADAGSIEKMRSPRRSLRVSNSRSGTLEDLSMQKSLPVTGSTHVHGMGGKHFITFSVKSSVGKLQSFRRALVSTSISPIGPSSSTKVPNGWRELIGCIEV